MKFFKFAFAAALALSAGSASAFHEGGVAYCEGCHTMHNSRNGASMVSGGTQFVGKTYLLQGTDQSSTCLVCHGKGTGGYNVFTNASATVTPKNWSPGGDFGWIKLGDRSWTYPRAGANVAQTRGHNIVAADKGIPADTRFTVAPGGVYPANQLHCSSCHDPHGKFRLTLNGYEANPGFTKGAPALSGAATKSLPIAASGSYGEAPTAEHAVGAYRLLAGVGYRPASVADAAGIPFANDPPVAVAPSTYNRSEAVTDTRVAYGQGMSEWCANCHGAIHNENYPTALIHPAGNNAKLSAEVYQNYNAYVASGDMTGSFAAAYTSLVPFEAGTADTVALLAKTTSTEGAADTDNVSCLSCHRAHASAFESMTRWNNRSEFLTVEGQYADYSRPSTDGELAAGNIAWGYTAAEYQAAMYDRPATKFATFQRSLCNKCHAKD